METFEEIGDYKPLDTIIENIIHDEYKPLAVQEDCSAIFGILTVYWFYIAYSKTYSRIRKKEAERYFNGSVVNKSKSYKERTYEHGLALARDEETGKYKFKKQAKMCDTALLYS